VSDNRLTTGINDRGAIEVRQEMHGDRVKTTGDTNPQQR
jgi:hypothetical protein